MASPASATIGSAPYTVQCGPVIGVWDGETLTLTYTGPADVATNEYVRKSMAAAVAQVARRQGIGKPSAEQDAPAPAPVPAPAKAADPKPTVTLYHGVYSDGELCAFYAIAPDGKVWVRGRGGSVWVKSIASASDVVAGNVWKRSCTTRACPCAEVPRPHAPGDEYVATQTQAGGKAAAEVVGPVAPGDTPMVAAPTPTATPAHRLPGDPAMATVPPKPAMPALPDEPFAWVRAGTQWWALRPNGVGAYYYGYPRTGNGWPLSGVTVASVCQRNAKSNPCQRNAKSNPKPARWYAPTVYAYYRHARAGAATFWYRIPRGGGEVQMWYEGCAGAWAKSSCAASEIIGEKGVEHVPWTHVPNAVVAVGVAYDYRVGPGSGDPYRRPLDSKEDKWETWSRLDKKWRGVGGDVVNFAAWEGPLPTGATDGDAGALGNPI